MTAHTVGNHVNTFLAKDEEIVFVPLPNKARVCRYSKFAVSCFECLDKHS
jgi:hypothetical protein